MIEDELEYGVTRDRVNMFSELVRRMKDGTADRIPGESELVWQLKLAGAEGVLQELQEEIAVWEASH